MVGIMVPRAISFKMTYASMLWLPGLLESVPLTPRQATVNLHLHQRLPLTGKSGSVSCEVTVPFSWVLIHTRFCLHPPTGCLPSPVEVL